MSKKIFIGVAWPYVNGDLHVGHLAGYLIPSDVTARFHRLKGNDVLMVSGSDCHGTPITVEADKSDKTPNEIVEYYHERDIKLFEKYQLSYNLYTTTTTDNHKEIVQELFIDLLNNGFILKKKEEQYYSPKDKKFLPDRYVEGECPHCHAKEQRSDQCENCGRMLEQGTLINPYSKLTKNEVTLKTTEHYYLDLSKLSDKLDAYIDDKKALWKKWVYSEAKGWIGEGLRARAITRDLDWGVEIPIDKIPEDLKLDTFENKRIYVWFEAVTGYLSAPQEWSKYASGVEKVGTDKIYNFYNGQSTDWGDWWKQDDAFHYQFLGQDNVVFHTILWQGQLLGSGRGYHLPDNIAANKFMNYEGKKFSKSRGWIIDSNEIADKYGVDAVRFYIAANLPENKEGNFAWDEFHAAINNELVANLGNFINRTLIFLESKFEGSIIGKREWLDDFEFNFSLDLNKNEVPDLLENQNNSDLWSHITNVFEVSSEYFDKSEIVSALDSIMKLSRLGNKLFNDSEIWVTVKNDKIEAEKMLFRLIQIVISLSILIEPIMPDASRNIRSMLGLDKLIPEVSRDQWRLDVVENIKLAKKVEPLFRKVELVDPSKS